MFHNGGVSFGGTVLAGDKKNASVWRHAHQYFVQRAALVIVVESLGGVEVAGRLTEAICAVEYDTDVVLALVKEAPSHGSVVAGHCLTIVLKGVEKGPNDSLIEQ